LSRATRATVTVIGLVLVLVLTLLAFRLPVFDSLKLIAEGAFGDKFGLSRTAIKTTPLLLTGLGMVVAWRAGMYNIGGEGQFIVGGLSGAWLAKSLIGGPLATAGPAGQILLLVVCALGGAAWAWLAGWLFVKRGVEVVISTILLNFIALQLLSWAVNGPLQEAKRQLPLTDPLPEALMLAKFDRQMDVHSGVLLALLVAVGVYVYLFLTKGGFQLRLVGENPKVARSYHINPDRTHLRAMLISGALCGLAGGVEYVGLSGQLGSGFSQQWGFLGIPVALLGGLHPLLVVLSATYFGALFAGSENLARFTTAGTTLIYVIQAAAVLGFVGLNALADRRPAIKPEATG